MALGPGLGTASHTRNLVYRMIKEIDLPLVIDADGLNNLAGHLGCLEGRKSATILTPHPGEMARLTGMSTIQIQEDRITAARNLAHQTKTHVVLKGARTLIAAPQGQVLINPTGNPGMASGGMGDVLTGLITGLVAQGHRALDACRIGVYLHGLAADMLSQKAPCGYLATEVMNTIPLAIQRTIDDPPEEPLGSLFL
jgi:NAD(P)H-hydrate epimerase